MKFSISKHYCIGYQIDKLHGDPIKINFDNLFQGDISIKFLKDKDGLFVKLDVDGVEYDYE